MRTKMVIFFIFNFYISIAQHPPIEYKNGNDKFIVFLYKHIIKKGVDGIRNHMINSVFVLFEPVKAKFIINDQKDYQAALIPMDNPRI